MLELYRVAQKKEIKRANSKVSPFNGDKSWCLRETIDTV